MRRQSWWHVVCANSTSTGNARIVLLTLSLHASRNGYVGIPITMIGALSNLSDKAVRIALKRLVQIKELFPFWMRSGRGNYNIYHITVSSSRMVDKDACRVGLLALPKPAEFPTLRIMEDPEIKGVYKPQV